MKKRLYNLILIFFIPLFATLHAMEEANDEVHWFTLSYSNILSQESYDSRAKRSLQKLSIGDRHTKFEAHVIAHKSDIMIFTNVPFQPSLRAAESNFPEHNQLIAKFLRKMSRNHGYQHVHGCSRLLHTGTLIMWNTNRFECLKTMRSRGITDGAPNTAFFVFLKDKDSEQVILIVGAFFTQDVHRDHLFYMNQIATLKALIEKAKSKILPVLELEDCPVVIGLTSYWNLLLSLTPDVTHYDRDAYQELFQSPQCFPIEHWTDLTYWYNLPYTARMSSFNTPDHTECIDHIIYSRPFFMDIDLEIHPKKYEQLLSLHNEGVDTREDWFYSNHHMIKATLALCPRIAGD